MDAKTRGGWVIHHAQKIKKVSGFHRFLNIQNAGTCGIFLAALAGTQKATITKEKAIIIASNAGLSPIDLDFAINELKNKNLIDTSRDKNEVHLVGLTQQAVLTHVGNIYGSLESNDEDEIAITIAEIASNKPIIKNTIKEEIQDTKNIPALKMTSILDASEKVGFFDKQEVDAESLYFNGNLFRRDYVIKAKKILDALTPEEAGKLNSLLELIIISPCILMSEAQQIAGIQLFNKLSSIGMFDISEISNARGKTQYVTRPAAYSKYGTANDDPLDDAKALVTSLTYGMNQSTRGRGKIMDISALMGKLINGGAVGPATAIGQDYTCLELKNVVKTEEQGNGMYTMRLLKTDVGELALQAINSGDISQHSLESFNSASISDFSGPENQRVNLRKSLPVCQADVIEMLRAVRG